MGVENGGGVCGRPMGAPTCTIDRLCRGGQWPPVEEGLM